MINLLPFQVEPARKLLSILLARGAAVDASDMGTGKTYVAAWVAAQAGLPVVVVCPKAVRAAWGRVLAAAGVTFQVFNWEQLNPRCKAHASVGKWVKRGRTEQWQWDLPGVTLIIYDEAHRAGGLTSRASRVVRAVDPEHPALLLSATLARSPLVMKAVCARLRICAPPEHYNWCRRYGAVISRWGRALEWPSGEHREGTKIYAAATKAQKKLKELHNLLYRGDSPYGIRIRKSEIPDFPINQIVTELADTDTYARDKDLQEAIAAVDEEGAISALELSMRKRQRAELRKVPLLLDEARDLIAEGHSVVVFCNYVETLNQLTKRWKGTYSSIRGNQSEAEREQNIEAFQTDENHVCFVQVQAGGVGLSLHALPGYRPRVSMLSPTYNAVDMVQALGRIHRAGGHTAVLQRIIFAAGTIEAEVYEAVSKKIKDIDTLNDGDLRCAPVEQTTAQRREEKTETGVNEMSNKSEAVSNLAKEQAKAVPAPKARKTRKARVCPCGKEISKGEEFFTFPEKALEREIQIAACSVDCLSKWHAARGKGIKEPTPEDLETTAVDHFLKAWGIDPWEDGFRGTFEVCPKHIVQLSDAVAGPKDHAWIEEKMLAVFARDPFEDKASIQLSQVAAKELVLAFNGATAEELDAVAAEEPVVKRDKPATVVHDGDGVMKDVPVEEPVHHHYGPSSLAYRETCPGWKNKGGTSEAAERGSICHLACELAENFRDFPVKFEYEGEQVELDKWEQANVRDALTGVRRILDYTMADMRDPAYEVLREEKLEILDGLTFGTADLVFHFHSENVLLVVDYKFGIHEVQASEDNPQGLAYALGALAKFPEAKLIRTCFIQPKLGQLDYHDYTPEALRGPGSTRVKTIIGRASSFDDGDLPDSELRATDACQYCARIGTCPAVAKYALSVGNDYAPVIEKPSVTDPAKFETPEQFAAALQLASILETWAPKVKAAAKEAMLEKGLDIPGYEIIYKKSPRVVKELAGVFNLATTDYDVDAQELLDAARIGLGDLEKMIKAAAPRGDKAKRLEAFEETLIEEGFLQGGDVEYPALRKLTKRNK